MVCNIDLESTEKPIEEVKMSLSPLFDNIKVKKGKPSSSWKPKADRKIQTSKFTFKLKKRRGDYLTKPDRANNDVDSGDGSIRRKIEFGVVSKSASIASSVASMITDGGKKGLSSSNIPNSSLAFVNPEDRKLMSDFSYFILRQLKFCGRTTDFTVQSADCGGGGKTVSKSKSKSNSKHAISAAAVVTPTIPRGIECIHCKGKKFRRFPATVSNAGGDYTAFRRHLEEECLECPINLREEMLSWEHNLPERTLESLAKWMLGRIGCFEGNDGIRVVSDSEQRKDEENAAMTISGFAQQKPRHSRSILESI